MPIKLLHHKSYHVYNSANIERVRRDEAAARAREQQEDEVLRQRDREQRIEILRRRQRGEPVETNEVSREERQDATQEATDADKAIEAAVATTAARGRKRPRNLDDELAAASTALKRAEKIGSSESVLKEGTHINFFEDLERAELEGRANAGTSGKNNEPQAQNLRNMRLDKPAEELSPWYSNMDMKSTTERSQTEKERDRLRQSSEKSKAALDPLAGIQVYLNRKVEIDQRRREKKLSEPWRRIERGTEAYYTGQTRPARRNFEIDNLENRDAVSGSSTSCRGHRDDERNRRDSRSSLNYNDVVTSKTSKSSSLSNEMQRLLREQEAREEKEQRAARELLRKEGTVSGRFNKR
ncbi:hypothetical protein V1525DRAFT_455202 [Lipomyces kononenkoae]|uniref:Uncharacterized protein n=1 Tax=Lipomyces kononenkoae TaxID=34357 RepID=A0ACC3T5T7_LIPKO